MDEAHVKRIGAAREAIVVAVALAALASCGGGASSDVAAVAPQTASESATTDLPESPIGPSMSSNSSCEDEYPLVLDPATLSVIATAHVTNDGDQAGHARVTAQWFPIGSDPIESEKVVTVEAGETVRIPFRVKPDQSAMNGMVGLKHGDEMCRVEAEVIP